MMEKQIPTTYDPALVEQKNYQAWEEAGVFHAEPGEGAAYSIVILPPNVTGQLHMGHALDNTLQDILIRWRRMQGYRTLWLPGTDHAGGGQCRYAVHPVRRAAHHVRRGQPPREPDRQRRAGIGLEAG